MWKINKVKRTARKSIKKSYSKAVSVCFLAAMLTNLYPVSTTFLNLQTSSVLKYSDAIFSLSGSNSEVIGDMVKEFMSGTPLSELFRGTLSQIVSLLIDLYSANISVFFTALRMVNRSFSNLPTTAVVLSSASILLACLYQIFVNYILIIGEQRFFLENRKYANTNISKIFYLYKLRCLLKPAWIMLCRSFFQLLWNLTVIGGIIKHYEYILIPYIIAENPRISRRDAFFLSKQLMHKNKKKLFFMDLSFIGWQILSVATLGLLSFLFVTPYITASRAEVYAVLRRNYVLGRNQRYEMLNDSYLEHVPSEDELLISKALYNDSQGPYTKVTYFDPEKYPVFLFSIQPPLDAVRPALKIDRKYDAASCIFLFHVFSAFGWLLEMLVHLTREGTLTQNPVILGPWIPLYGIFGLLILKVMPCKIRKNPVAVFTFCFIAYSALEYLFNFTYELEYGETLRDYSNFFLNLNGRIYLGGSVSYALLGCAFLYFLAPLWTDFFLKRRKTHRTIICIVLTLLLLFAILYTISTRYGLFFIVDF